MATQKTLGSEILDGATGGPLLGTNFSTGRGILNAQEAVDPRQQRLTNAAIVASLAGAGAVVVNEFWQNRS